MHLWAENAAGAASAGTRKGRDSQRRILETAVEVFLRAGYANFTMRAVAEAAGISSGNLTYYFPRKGALLQAMTEYVIDGYLEEFERQRRRDPDNPARQLEHVLDFWIDDLGTARTTRFFPELWALANHDREAARLMNYVYERAREVLVRILTEQHPQLEPAAIDAATVLMSATMEGLTLFAGYRKPWAGERERLKRMLKAMFAQLPERA